MAQMVKHPTLNFGLDNDLMVCDFKSCALLCADSAEPAWDSLSPSLSAPSPLSLSLSLKINKNK